MPYNECTGRAAVNGKQAGREWKEGVLIEDALFYLGFSSDQRLRSIVTSFTTGVWPDTLDDNCRRYWR